MKRLLLLTLSVLALVNLRAEIAPEHYVAAVIWPSCHNDSLTLASFWNYHRYGADDNELLFDAIGNYVMGPRSGDYVNCCDKAILKLDENQDRYAKLGLSFIPTASIGWDNTPRFPQYGIEKTISANRTPGRIFRVRLP